MKTFFLAIAALSLPAASHAFIAAKSSSAITKKSTTLFQQQYYDENGNPVYYGEQQQNYDQQGQYYDQNQQQYYDQNQQYAQDQQQQYYDQNQQQQFIVQEEEPSLFISEDMSGEMARATNGIEMGGIDYLALARQRAANRVESNNSMSSDADWVNLAEQKRLEKGEYADDEDWEKSLEDEGSLNDSAALGMGVKLEEAEGGVMMTEGGLVVDNYGGEGGDEPQLLL